MLPKTRNEKRNVKREQYEKRNFEVSHVQETKRERKIRLMVKKEDLSDCSKGKRKMTGKNGEGQDSDAEDRERHEQAGYIH